jgi:hypothetical protein
MAKLTSKAQVFHVWGGSTFNKLSTGVKFYKIINRNGIHQDMTYDVNAKEPVLYKLDGGLDLSTGQEGVGLHFFDASQVDRLWTTICLCSDPAFLATVTIPDHAIVQRREHAYKATHFILSDIRPLDLTEFFDSDEELLNAASVGRAHGCWMALFVPDAQRAKLLAAYANTNTLRNLHMNLHKVCTLDMFKASVKKDGDDLYLAMRLFKGQVTREMCIDAVNAEDGIHQLDKIDLKQFGCEPLVLWIERNHSYGNIVWASNVLTNMVKKIVECFTAEEVHRICNAIVETAKFSGVSVIKLTAQLYTSCAKHQNTLARKATLRQHPKRRRLENAN